MGKIKEMREAQKLSRAELGRRSGVPVRTLEDWDKGARIPRDVYQIRKVAKALGCSIEDLLDTTDPE